MMEKERELTNEEKASIKKMDMKMQTEDKTKQNIDKIIELFPNVVSETRDNDGNVKQGIDFDLLKQQLEDVLVEDDMERYRLDWPGKKASLLKANTPISKTLRPCRDDSVNFDNTKNLYLEGDNFEVLKVLQESYLNKIKMIYIDPPYNTGKDFVYTDKFKIDKAEYEAEIGVHDDEGGKLFKNTDTNGRFHSDWLSMMYERLLVSRDLLKDDGVIFISIDDNEVHNLKKICDEVFGEENFVECLIWKKRATPPNDRNIGRIHEFILCYAKMINYTKLGLLPRDAKSISRYSNPDNDIRGNWVASDLSANGKGGRIVQSCVYPITNPITNKSYLPSEGKCWLFNQKKTTNWINQGRISFRANTGAPFLKRYLSEVRPGLTLPTILTEFGYSSTSSSEADKIFVKKGIFEYAKPTSLIIALLRIGIPTKSDLILDFFSGSATTAHAVMKLNAEDGGNRKHIMVQLPEKTDEKSEAYKAGYKEITQIGQERIRRAGKQIIEGLEEDKSKLTEKGDNLFENGEAQKIQDKIDKLDIGFRVYKVDSSNMKDVYYHPEKYDQMNIEDLITNVKEDRTPEDLLTQVILDLGLELNLPIEVKKISGNDFYFVEGNALVACFDDNINFKAIDEIAKAEPMKAVFKDSSFSSDMDKINLETRFKRLSPDTVIRVF